MFFKIVISGSATATMICVPRFRRWRTARTLAYVALGASSFVPLLHGVQLYGLDYMLQYSGMKWYLLELAFYSSGVGLYAVGLLRLLHLLRETSDLTDICSSERRSASRQANLIFGGARTRSFMSLSCVPCTHM